uniref:Uncharacterized protein n=1 Tax=Chlorobium chlorochromatii (strain CaD3) TaxID=340177 RepID=Q3ATZ3_CHLCH
MIDVKPFENCVCQKMNNHLSLCKSELTLSEKGKSVTLRIRSSEEAKVLVLDGCVFMDNSSRCDGLYLYKKGNKRYALLVELKGACDIPHGFEQLAYVKKNRQEYRQIVDHFWVEAGGVQPIEKAFLVSNGSLSKPDLETLEKQHNIRVTAILHCEATSQIPDLRKYL